MVYDIQFEKGSYSVDLHADNVSEEYTNKLVVLSLPQTATNQASGKKDTKILDLLRITHQFVIKGYIAATATKTAKDIKNDLITLANGSGEAGGEITMTYDGDTYTGYLEKVVAIKESSDSPDDESTDEVKYSLALTFIVGVEV